MAAKNARRIGWLLAAAAILPFNRPAPAEEGAQLYQDPARPTAERVADLVSRLTLEEKVSLLGHHAAAVPRLGIPLYNYGNEGLHGVVRPGPATVFPQAIALAATWDPGLVQQVATAISDEARATDNKANHEPQGPSAGLHTVWSPTVNMARDPRWGRTPETYGEDPFLTGRIGVGFVKGLQGDDPNYIKVVATPKHFVANNEDENRTVCNARISERALREYYLPAFRTCIVEGGACSIMGAYNALNGVPCCANPRLLTDILRGEWGFQGYVVSDCGAITWLQTDHKYTATPEESCAVAWKAGMDLECGDVFQLNAVNAVKTGLLSEQDVDRALTNVLAVRFRLGMFDPPERIPYHRIPAETLGCRKHVELARQAARESIVLLKNEPHDHARLLPIDRERVKSIAVIGPHADRCEFGDYSGKPANPPVTPLEGIRNRAGEGVAVHHVAWVLPEQERHPIPADDLRPAGGKPDERGLRGEYFHNRDLAGEPALTRVDANVNFDWRGEDPDPTVPKEDYSIRWTGQLVPSASGDRELWVRSDDGVRLYLDGKLLIDQWHARPPTWDHVGVSLEAGRAYDVRMEYYQGSGERAAVLAWTDPGPDRKNLQAESIALARKVDLVVALLGLDLEDEREGRDRKDLDLPPHQERFLREVVAANPRTVLVLINGSPLAINWAQEHVPAILEAWYAGEQGGNAIADVLFGEYNPGGRLPLTFYASLDQLPPFNDYEISRGRTYMYLKEPPLYPFGHGLSYSTFTYGDLRLSAKELPSTDTLEVTCTVANTGDRDGDEVVQVYVRDLESTVQQPLKRLHAFQRIHLKKGEKKPVLLSLAASNLAFWDEKANRSIVEPGAFEVMVGASSSDIRLRDTFQVKTSGTP